jgi:type IX secretion system substrate protein
MKKILNIFIIIIATAITLNAADPVISNVAILGEGLYNSTPNPDEATTLTGTYDFSDADGHTDASTYNWYVDTDNDGLWTDEASVATTIRYTVASADVGHDIFFVVTPLDSNGDTDNTDVASAASAISSTTYTDFDSNVNVNITSDTDWLNGYIKQNRTLTINGAYTLTIHGDFGLVDGGITINLSNGASLVVKGQLITENNLDINVDATSSFIIESGLDARNNSALDISGTMTVNGDVTVEQNASFDINDGGALDVAGDLNTGDNADLTIEGDVSLGNNTDVIVDGTAPAGGTLVIGGDLDSGTGSTLTGDGPVDVGGDVSGPITGDDQLPIELVYFTANFENNFVKIDWVTAAEINNDYFTIERSYNGIDFETIITRSGHGNSSQLISYTEYDYSPSSGISYYRLKQTDYDGLYSYSKIVGVNNTLLKSSATQVNVFPNPFKVGSGILNIQVSDFDEEELFNISVVDITGRIIYESLENTGSSIMTIQFSNDIPKGTYFVVISISDEREVSKLIIN